MEDVTKLSKYLDDTVFFLNNTDRFLLDNIKLLSKENIKINNFLSKYDYQNTTIKNNLSLDCLYSLSFDILSKINVGYLNDLTNIISNGILQFDSNSASFYQKQGCSDLININRKYNYSDVVSLMHEFFHYTNGHSFKDLSENRYLLTEFISIYFELISIKYLVDNGVNKDEILYTDRLKNTYLNSNFMFSYDLLLTSFYKYHTINYNFINKYVRSVSIDCYNYDVSNLLSYFEYYHSKGKDIDDIVREGFSDDYRYIFGTMLAFYALDNCDIDSIIYLNKNINGHLGYLNLFDVLKIIGINVNSEFLNKCFDSILNYNKKFDIKLKVK